MTIYFLQVYILSVCEYYFASMLRFLVLILLSLLYHELNSDVVLATRELVPLSYVPSPIILFLEVLFYKITTKGWICTSSCVWCGF